MPIALKSHDVRARPAARAGRAWSTWSSTAFACPRRRTCRPCWSCASAPATCAASFECKDNVAPQLSTRALMEEPAGFDYMRLAHPPVTFRQEKLKGEERIPAARRYIVEHQLNETGPARTATSASSCRAACTTRWCARCSSSAWPTRSAPATSRCWCSTSPIRWCPSEVARLLRRQARGAGGRGRPARIHRAGDRHAAAPARHPDAAARQGHAAGGRRVHASRCWRRGC